LTAISCEQFTSKTEDHHATPTRKSLLFLFFHHTTNNTSAARYFKNYKLDYPNTETNKASKKYVKAMKKLPVLSALLYAWPGLIIVGNHT
jgi:hypothetical protein